ncbi:glycosyltransferase family 4 protein [Thalassolituus sp. LLYu03]|uniref:glycosyltransferase family 4 protein n=1 Tax=Thalassolituus sp. LLYu03 TaxID=3421656 RepID=UPI003D2667E2
MATRESRKKLLLVADEYPPALGGAGTVAATMYRLLNDYYDVTLVSGSGFNDQADYFITKIPLLWPIQYWWLFRDIDIDSFDAVVLNDGPVQYAANFFLPFFSKVRIYSFVHGIEKLLLEPTFYSRVLLYRYFLGRTYQKSTRVLSVSKYISGKTLEFFPFLSKRKPIVLYNPLSFSVLEPVQNNFKLLSVSRLEKGKGYDRMLRVFTELKRQDSRWTWSIVGDGSYAKSFESKCKDSGHIDTIKFYGAVRHEDLVSIYREHSVFILLSELEESFGLSYLEAVCCGIPSISYNQYGPAEIARHVAGCWTVDYEMTDDAIATVIREVDQFDGSLTEGLMVFSIEGYSKAITEVLQGA